MYKCYYIAIRHKESNWAKFLKQDLEGAVCAPAHLFHRVGNQLKLIAGYLGLHFVPDFSL